jgi:hypothetical protein
MTKEQELFKLCSKFIEDNNISWAEQVYQNDRLVTQYYQFVESICDIVGYQATNEEEDE